MFVPLFKLSLKSIPESTKSAKSFGILHISSSHTGSRIATSCNVPANDRNMLILMLVVYRNVDFIFDLISFSVDNFML